MQASMQSIFKDLNARTSEEDFSRISTRSSYKDLCWFMQGPLRKFPQDHCKILSQGIVKEPASSRSSCQDYMNPRRPSKKDSLLLLLLQRILQDLGTRNSQEHPRRAWTQAPLRLCICKTLMQGPLREDLARISTRSSDKDLCRVSYRTPPGPLQDLLTRTLTRPWPRS